MKDNKVKGQSSSFTLKILAMNLSPPKRPLRRISQYKDDMRHVCRARGQLLTPD
jgi:hypothetical protein